jgi:hypothetical protein
VFLDAVIRKANAEVVYNSIPINVRKWLEKLSEAGWNDFDVYDGEKLKRWTVAEYLNRQWEVPELKK